MSVSLEERQPMETDEQGRIKYQLYGQDGVLVPMTCRDTPHNRKFVIMIRQIDRYAGVGRP